MSKVVDNAIQEVKKSEFLFDGKTLEVRNAVIFWTNFAGVPNQFGNDARTFNIAVNEELSGVLIAAGWRVRDKVNDEGETLWFVNVKVNMNSSYPPVISLFNEYKGKKNKRQLDVESVGEIDRLDIRSADCIINAYESAKFPGKVTGYLQKLNVIQEPAVEFGGKYDEWEDEEYDCLAAGTCTLEEFNEIQRRKGKPTIG